MSLKDRLKKLEHLSPQPKQSWFTIITYKDEPGRYFLPNGQALTLDRVQAFQESHNLIVRTIQR